ncbi:MAG: hypothetical protein HWE24_14825 [Oceanospirillaceae bacterium]|nr:hypothetical protein [Oceanospirillaceae bacterium]
MNSINKYISKLTKPQITFLKELLAHNKRGNYNALAVNTTPCSEIGEWIGKENFTVNIVSESIYKLASYGFVAFRSLHDINLRFDYVEITPLGKGALTHYE